MVQAEPGKVKYMKLNNSIHITASLGIHSSVLFPPSLWVQVAKSMVTSQVIRDTGVSVLAVPSLCILTLMS